MRKENIMQKFGPQDWIALILVIGCLFLIAMGKDSVLGYTLGVLVGGYFGYRLKNGFFRKK